MKIILLPVFLIGTIIMMMVMKQTGKPLKTTNTTAGIINLEFASSANKVNAVLDQWKSTLLQPENKIATAKINTWWDFLFIFFYSGTLFLLCHKLKAACNGKAWFITTGKYIGALALMAGLLDIFENICMFQSLNGNVQEWLAKTTTICAYIKFTFVALAVLYVLVALILSAFYGINGRTRG
jgi:hypothetical protein